ncbi:MAG: DUF3575 domain-containing protein [Muribaculaceae bacterium]|nr:DUF3575 domain-containing protein [Muribaculaceae bacterium]
MKRLRYLLILVMVLIGSGHAGAQKVALKSNLLSDAFLNPNIGVEAPLAKKWSLDMSGQINLWTVDGHKWRHWLVQPELRYWFCNRFNGHFIGVHALGGEYNMGNLDWDFSFLGTDFRNLKDRRYEGWGIGAGIAYGYSWILDKHWNLEAELGLGWIYTRFDAYPCANCGTKLESDKSHNYYGPTKAAINIVYLF